MSDRIEIDAKDVLDKYIALIRKTRGRSPQDVSALPASKAVLKAILLHVLTNSPQGSNLTPIKQAYLELAVFQAQQNAATRTLDRWQERMDEHCDSSMTDAELRAVAQRTVSTQGFLDSIKGQIELERASLAVELTNAGF